MKKNNLYILFPLSLIIILSACERVDPMASEQYRKEIYIVGSYNRVSSFDIPYGDNQEAFLSVAVSGTLPTERDVDVMLKRSDDIISWYNNRYMLDAPVKYRQLDTERIHIPSWRTTIKAGDVYARFPFTVTTTGLHCDSLYAIGFAIDSISDYQKSEKDTVVILTLKLTNEFSGIYLMEAAKSTLKEEDGQWIETGMPIPVIIHRTLTAVSSNSVRFFHEKQKETLSEYSNSWDPGKDYFHAIDNYCIVLSRIDETNTFAIMPWSSMNILDGEATFDDGTFSFWYDYKEGASRYRMKGTFTKSNDTEEG